MNKKILLTFLCLTIPWASILYAPEPEKTTDKYGKVVPGTYEIGTNGLYYPVTNSAKWWTGIWKESASGLRVQVSLWATNTSDPMISVGLGSVVTNSGSYYLRPDRKFAKFELRDSQGVVVPPIKGKSMETDCDPKIPAKVFKQKSGYPSNNIGFFSNSPPETLNRFYLSSVYQIKKEDDYTIRVCAVVYKYGTNTEFLNRVDLPCISAKLHLLPQANE